MARSVSALIGLIAAVVLAAAGVAPASATVTSVVVASPGNQTSFQDLDITPVQMHASGGTQPYHWSATGLPRMVFIDANTGLITGEAENAPGTLTTTVTAVDANGVSGNVTFQWQILAGCHHC